MSSPSFSTGASPHTDQPADEAVPSADEPVETPADPEIPSTEAPQDEAPQDEGSSESAPAEPAGPVWIPAEHGQCPICELEFDDPVSYRAHLAAEHDLHDDEGTETEFGVLAVPVVAGPAHRPPVLPGVERAERPKEAPTMERPVGLLAFVAVLLVAFVGLVITRSGDGGEDDGDEELVLEDGTVRRVPGPTSVDDAPEESAPDGAASGADATTPPEATPAAVAPIVATPPPAPTTTAAPVPTTTVPPATTFASPTTSGAHLDSCQREKNSWRVTYSWTFSGGRLWKPLGAYKALGGGAYSHTIVVPRHDDVVISVVFVSDPKGAQHAVTLKPALSTASC